MVRRNIGIILAVIVFVVQAMLVPHAGMSWDEPSSFFVGRANLMYWITGDRQYVINMWDKTKFPDSPIQYIYGEDIYPPFPFTVASAFSYVFAERMHIVNFIDAHHLGEIAIASAGVWAMYGILTAAGLSVPAAVVTTLIYTLYPSIWGPMRNDAKDIPLVSMLVISVYFFLQWLRLWTKREYAKASVPGILFGVSYGLAGASKPTAALLVPIITVWILTAVLRSRVFAKSLGNIRNFVVNALLLLVLSAATFLFAWPWLWDRPVTKLAAIFSFFKTVGFNMPTPYFGTIYHAAVNLPYDYAYVILLVQTPVLILLFAAVGLLWSVWRYFGRRQVTPWLFAVWFVLAMGRFLIPGVIIYAWVRHFIDAMPAFFVLAGYGIEYTAVRVSGVLKRLPGTAGKPYVSPAAVICILGGIVIVHQAIISAQLFPFETSYFNMFVGGTKGVADRWLFDVGQGAGVKEAMEFVVKDSGGKPVTVYPCLMGHLARFYTPPNVTLTRFPEMGTYAIAPNSPSWFEGSLTFHRSQHDLAYTVSRGGADLFYVFKNKNHVGWRCGWETLSNYVW